MIRCSSFQKLRQVLTFYRKSPHKSTSYNYSDECAVKKGLILGFYDGDNDEPCFTPAAQKFNDSLGGKLFDLVKESRGELGKGKSKIYNNINHDYWAVAVVGLGKENQGYNELEAIDEGLESVRQAAGIGARTLSQQGVNRILIEGLGHVEQAAEGAALALWKYQENKNRDKWDVIPSLELYDDPDTEDWQRGLFKAESQNLARRLSDTPGNQMTPLHFAQETVNELCPCGVIVEVRDKDWIEHKKMNGFLAVARGSCEPPVLLNIMYCGGPAEEKPIMLVGKGVTFDSGGLCLKDQRIMPIHRGDMSGAAAVVGAIRAANALSLPINIYAVIPLCENMPSGMAMKCGDVVTALNGKSIYIQNTDNEGRVVMADALVYAQTTFKPKMIIDVTSMTSSIRKALGSGACGVFCNSQTLWSQVRKAGIISGDRVWRMPLWKYYTDRVTGYSSHDVNNKGRGYGDPCLAAAFLNEFLTCIDWIHFDTTGAGMVAEDKLVSYYTKGRMTGRPTRALIQLLYQLACPSEGSKELK